MNNPGITMSTIGQGIANNPINNFNLDYQSQQSGNQAQWQRYANMFGYTPYTKVAVQGVQGVGGNTSSAGDVVNWAGDQQNFAQWQKFSATPFANSQNLSMTQSNFNPYSNAFQRLYGANGVYNG